MEEMTVQVTADSTESRVADADCGSAEHFGAVPTQETLSSESAKETWPLTDGHATEAGAKTDAGEADAVTFMPVYKGKVYPIAASDTEEITTLLQLGMKQREMQPLMEDLQRLATAHGSKSIRDFVQRAKEESDTQALEAAVAAYGEQEGRAYFEAQQQRMQQRKIVSADDRLLMSERLAAEFYDLRHEFAEYTAIEQLPKEVIHTALRESIPLMDAMLRYQHRQARQVEAGKRAAVRSAAAATGSLRQSGDNRSSAAMDAFLRGLHRRL